MSTNLTVARNYAKHIRGADPRFGEAFEAIIKEIEAIRGIIPEAEKISDFSSVAYNSLNHTSNAGTWVVDSADITTYGFKIKNENEMTLAWYITLSTITGAPTELRLAIPEGYRVSRIGGGQYRNPCQSIDNGVAQTTPGIAVAVTGEGFVRIYRDFAGLAWTNCTNLAGTVGQLILGVSK